MTMRISKAALFFAFLGLPSYVHASYDRGDRTGRTSSPTVWSGEAASLFSHPNSPTKTLTKSSASEPTPSQTPSQTPSHAPSHAPSQAPSQTTEGPSTDAPTSAPTSGAVVPRGLPLSCPDVLPKYTEIEGNTTLRYAVLPSDPPGSRNGVLCGRLEAQHDGWISLALSRTPGMIGAESIIALPQANTVLKYNMFGYDEVVPMSDERQTLTNTYIEEEEDGRTIMGFTKLLVEDGEIPIKEEGANIFLYASGRHSFRFHETFLSFRRDLAEGQDVGVEEDATDVAPVTAKDCTKEFCDFELDPDYLLKYRLNVPEDASVAVCTGCTVSMELIHEGEAWVSIAFSNDGKMIGGEAVIGIPGGSVLKYTMGSKETSGVSPMPESQQTLLDASIEVVDGQTIMKFTKIMKEPGEIEVVAGDNNLMGAYGGDGVLATHIARQSVVLNLASGASEEVQIPNRAAWIVHGVLAFLAWGVLVPFAVQASLLRALLPKGPLWMKIHKLFNTASYALFVLTFVVSIVYTAKEGGRHFSNGHQRMGLIMLLLTSVQMFGGAFRPPNPPPGEAKALARGVWERGHRVLGVSLLACAFWQMSGGIRLFAFKYAVSESGEDGLVAAYWSWIGVMSAVIVVGGGYFKYRRGVVENVGSAPGNDVGETPSEKAPGDVEKKIPADDDGILEGTTKEIYEDDSKGRSEGNGGEVPGDEDEKDRDA